MKKILLTGLMLAALLPLGASAAPGEDALSQCLADNTTGKDRKDLVQWIFVGIAAHPQLKPYAKVSEADLDQSSRQAAALMMRLLTETCVAEVRAQVKAGNTDALKSAFQYLGGLAMRELMSNPDVGSAMGRIERFLDASKVQAAVSGAAAPAQKTP